LLQISRPLTGLLLFERQVFVSPNARHQSAPLAGSSGGIAGDSSRFRATGTATTIGCLRRFGRD
jgi:hypothetical protein